MTPPRRSKRQLYLGIFFVSLAFLVAIVRTVSSGGPGTPDGLTRVREHIGITMEQAIDQLGEPTSRAEFYADEDFNSDRAATIERMRESNKAMPEVFLELAWFSPEDLLAIRFPGEFNENGDAQASGVSIDAVRRKLPTPANDSTSE
ncbi:MAG: hypothetical protein ACIAQF_09735 [Phycisphaerales bacterium JB065]